MAHGGSPGVHGLRQGPRRFKDRGQNYFAFGVLPSTRVQRHAADLRTSTCTPPRDCPTYGPVDGWNNGPDHGGSRGRCQWQDKIEEIEKEQKEQWLLLSGRMQKLRQLPQQ